MMEKSSYQLPPISGEKISAAEPLKRIDRCRNNGWIFFSAAKYFGPNVCKNPIAKPDPEAFMSEAVGWGKVPVVTLDI